jgi:hypothetical protein
MPRVKKASAQANLGHGFSRCPSGVYLTGRENVPKGFDLLGQERHQAMQDALRSDAETELAPGACLAGLVQSGWPRVGLYSLRPSRAVIPRRGIRRGGRDGIGRCFPSSWALERMPEPMFRAWQHRPDDRCRLVAQCDHDHLCRLAHLQNDSATSAVALQHHHIFSRRRFRRACLTARLSARLLRRRSRLSAAVAASALSGAPTSIAAAAPPRTATRNLRLVWGVLSSIAMYFVLHALPA